MKKRSPFINGFTLATLIIFILSCNTNRNKTVSQTSADTISCHNNMPERFAKVAVDKCTIIGESLS